MKRWLIVGMIVVMGQVFSAAAVEPAIPQYDNRFGFSFDRAVFDHNKADCIYFGVDFWMPYFFSHSRNSHFGHLYPVLRKKTQCFSAGMNSDCVNSIVSLKSFLDSTTKSLKN